MPVILVTNDDGISSKGIKTLARILESVGDVYVIAPETEQSAVAHALTLHRPLKSEKINKRTFSINGTPTDCVIIGVNKLLPQRPDILLSGINNGGNLGDDVTYSGTVAAAIEGTLLGIPSIAVSLAVDDLNNGVHKERPGGLKKAAGFALKLAEMVLERGLPKDTLLNVNVPDCRNIMGMKFTVQGKRIYDSAIQELLDPRGRKFYWIGGGIPQGEGGVNTDVKAVQKGYVSITPVHLDLTNHKALKHFKQEWEI